MTMTMIVWIRRVAFAFLRDRPQSQQDVAHVVECLPAARLEYPSGRRPASWLSRSPRRRCRPGIDGVCSRGAKDRADGLITPESSAASATHPRGFSVGTGVLRAKPISHDQVGKPHAFRSDFWMFHSLWQHIAPPDHVGSHLQSLRGRQAHRFGGMHGRSIGDMAFLRHW